MHVAMIADTAWLADEQAMFRFLVVGLMGEHLRVAQVVPQQAGDHQTSLFGATLLWRDTRLELIRRRQITAMTADLEELKVSVVHALDGRLWGGALKVAQQLAIPAVLNVSSAEDLARLGPLRRLTATHRIGFSVATTPLRNAVREALGDGVLADHIPLGAHVSTEPIAPPNPDALCVVITGSGACDGDFQMLLDALAKFVAEHPGTLLFFDCQGGDPHQIWETVRHFGLLEQSSMIPARTDHRELLRGAHVLIQPQPLGRARCITLEAMACGLPVLARVDPWLDYLIDGKTSWVSDTNDSAAWAHLIRRPIEQVNTAQKLGHSARQWIRDHHLAADQVERTINLYRRLTGESFRFPQPHH